MRPVPLTTLAHELLRQHLQPGDFAIDATAGNGHDMEFLAKTVGPAGMVWAFDVQEQAIAASEYRRYQAGLTWVHLRQVSHSQMKAVIPEEYHGKLAAVMFNLGYLPGGDKSITTTATETITALEQALMLLSATGLLTVMLYPGHPAGAAETQAVREWAQGLPAFFEVQTQQYAERGPLSAILMTIHKRPESTLHTL